MNIVAAATIVSALIGALAVLVVGLAGRQSKALAEIHVLVNSRLSKALAEIKALKAEIRDLRRQ